MSSLFVLQADAKHCEEILLNLHSRGLRFSLISATRHASGADPDRPACRGDVGEMVSSAVVALAAAQARIHRAIAGARSTVRWASKRRAYAKNPNDVAMITHGLTPMEHKVWHDVSDFLWLWRNVIASGMIDSTGTTCMHVGQASCSITK